MGEKITVIGQGGGCVGSNQRADLRDIKTPAVAVPGPRMHATQGEAVMGLILDIGERLQTARFTRKDLAYISEGLRILHGTVDDALSGIDAGM